MASWSHTYVAPAPEPARTRVSARNLAGLRRYLWLRLRYPRLRVGLFFADRGAEIVVGPRARLCVGRGVRLMRDFSGHFDGTVTLGDSVFFNHSCTVVVRHSLTIGDHSLFGEGVSIHDENHVGGPGVTSLAARGFVAAPIVVGSNVWVGARAVILSGVRIGDGAVIGAGAVVTRDIPAGVLAAGVPARVVRRLPGCCL